MKNQLIPFASLLSALIFVLSFTASASYPPPTVLADFSYTLNGIQFQFTDQSVGAESWFWDFGNGATSTMQNPAYVFPEEGTYNVCLTITGGGDSSSVCKVVSAPAPGNVSLCWNQTFSKATDVYTESRIQTDGSNVYVASNNNGRITLSKFNSSGTKLWTYIIQSANHAYDIADMKVRDGNICLVALFKNFNPFHEEWATMEFDLDGTLKWQKFFHVSPYVYNEPYGVTIGADGSIRVVGWCGTYWSQLRNSYIVKYSSTGKFQWSKSFDFSEEDDIFTNVVVDDYGNAYAVGGGGCCFGDGEYFVMVKYDKNGEKQWMRNYGSSSDFNEIEFASIDDDGNIVIAGKSNDFYGYGSVSILKYTPDGSLVWSIKYDGDIEDTYEMYFYLTGLAIDSANNIYFNTYASYRTPSFTVKLDKTGNVVWENEYTGSLGSSFRPAAMVANDAGNISVAGEVDVDHHYPIDSIMSETYSLNSNGEIEWFQTYGELYQQNRSSAEGIDENGNTYVAVVSAVPQAKFNALLLRYSSDCSQQPTPDKSGKILSSRIDEVTELNVFPNPASDFAEIQFSLSQNENITIDLLDPAGRKIKTITNGNFSEGNYLLTFDRGLLSSGIYFLQMKTGNEVVSRKLLIR